MGIGEDKRYFDREVQVEMNDNHLNIFLNMLRSPPNSEAKRITSYFSVVLSY